MAQNAIGNSANIFLQGGQMYQNANSKIFDAITQAADMYQRQQMQREANLNDQRLKQQEIDAAKTKYAVEQSQDPQFILAKAIQNGPESLTPQERSTFQANQQLESSKVALDAFGRPYNPRTAVSLDGAPAQSPMQPQASQSPVGNMLLPPPGRGQTGDTSMFDSTPTPQPIGYKAEKSIAENPIAATPTGQFEQLKSDMETERDQRKSEFERSKKLREALPKLNASFNAMMGDVSNVNKKADRAKGQINRLNTGPLAGNDGSGVYGSGYVTGGKDLAATLKTLQADTAFGSLQEMRDNSPTGGALGGVSERELGLLQSAKTNLEQSQSPDQLKANLEEYKTIRLNALKNAAEAYKTDYGNYPKGYEPADDVTAKLKAAGYSGAQIQAYKKAKGL